MSSLNNFNCSARTSLTKVKNQAKFLIMNTAISLDISVFQEAKREAEHLHMSLPDFCSMAIQEFVKNNKKSAITNQLDTFYSTHKAKIADDILQAQYELLDEENW